MGSSLPGAIGRGEHRLKSVHEEKDPLFVVRTLLPVKNMLFFNAKNREVLLKIPHDFQEGVESVSDAGKKSASIYWRQVFKDIFTLYFFLTLCSHWRRGLRLSWNVAFGKTIVDSISFVLIWAFTCQWGDSGETGRGRDIPSCWHPWLCFESAQSVIVVVSPNKNGMPGVVLKLKLLSWSETGVLPPVLYPQSNYFFIAKKQF